MRELTESGNAPADPDGRFTLPATRLAGSEACLNCGTGLKGPFCHYCGQPDRRIMRFFPVLLREFLEDFADFDSRFARTLKPLLFRPGRLTRDFLDGRRFRYSPPLRLYLFSSIVFFLLAAMVSTGPLTISSGVDDQGDRSLSVGISEAIDEPEPGGAPADAQAGAGERPPAEESETVPDVVEEIPELHFNDRPWHRTENPVTIPLFPARLNDWINDEIAESPRKGRAIADDPGAFVDQVMDLLPGTMFVLLPVFALILKAWYLFAKRYYVEHLVLSLHNHAFLFVLMSILVALDALGTALASYTALFWVIEMVGVVIFFWMPVYLLISLKTVYRQSWPMTLAKGVVIFMSYSMLALTVTVFIAMLGFLLF